MVEQLPPQPVDEPLGDLGDQATRLQMAEERAAIEAALAGRVRGTDALDVRSPMVDPLEGPDLHDAESADSSDDPVYGGGTPMTDPEQVRLDPVLSGGDRAAEALDDELVGPRDEGSTVSDGATRFELDGDPDILGTGPAPADGADARDLDALVGSDLGHDPDDPRDRDGYGLPPAVGGAVAAVEPYDAVGDD